MSKNIHKNLLYMPQARMKADVVGSNFRVAGMASDDGGKKVVTKV